MAVKIEQKRLASGARGTYSTPPDHLAGGQRASRAFPTNPALASTFGPACLVRLLPPKVQLWLRRCS